MKLCASMSFLSMPNYGVSRDFSARAELFWKTIDIQLSSCDTVLTHINEIQKWIKRRKSKPGHDAKLQTFSEIILSQHNGKKITRRAETSPRPLIPPNYCWHHNAETAKILLKLPGSGSAPKSSRLLLESRPSLKKS